MRVLYLCHRIPFPPNKGDKIRAFNQLRAMSAEHDVDLFTLADDPNDLAYTADLKRICRSVTVAPIDRTKARIRALPYLLSRKPLTVPYFYSKELAGAVRDALRGSYDRIFVYCSAMAQYLEPRVDVPVIADFVDVDSDKWQQYAAFARFPFSTVYRREGRLLQEYERLLCERSACAVVTTLREASLLRTIAPGANVQVVANGVDAEYFSDTAVPRDTVAPPGIVFTGDMSYFPNEQAVIWFAREVLPIILRSVPAARFLIVGRNPGPSVRSLEQLQGVEVTGFVPDVRTYLSKSLVAVAPFRIAAGIQNKILEAMAYGLPVVATPRATQGLTDTVAPFVRTGETAAEFAGQTLNFLRQPDEAAAAGAEGRRLITQEYSWTRAATQTLDLLAHPAPRTKSTVAQASTA